MLDKIKTALGMAGASEPARVSPPSRALVPVPIVRPLAAPEKPQASMGYLDRNPDSARPPLRAAAPMLRSADQEIRVAHAPVAGAVRHLLTQSGFLAYGVELMAAWMVGGYGLEPTISPKSDALGWQPAFAKTWASFLAARFAEWADDPQSCDAQGRQKFGALQSAAVRSYLATGDVLAVIDYGEKSNTAWKTAVSLVDPSRLWTPPAWYGSNVALRDGVEFDDRGRALAYHLRPLPGHHETIRVPVFSPDGKRLLSHSFDAEPGAIRGISPLGAAIGGIMQAMNTHDAAVLASHVAAMIVGVVTSDLPSDAVARSIGGPDGNPLAAMMEARTSWHETLKKADAHLRLGHGARIAHLSTGEKFDLYAGRVPFTEYEKIIRLGLAEAARALGLAPEFLHGLKDQATYSSLKAAAVEARAIVERRRRIIVEPLCEFALWSVAEELIADGRLPWPAPVRDRLADFRRRRHLIRVEWRGPAIEDPDALKAAKAAIERVRWGLSSLSDEIAATGRDAETVYRNRAEDQAMLTELGLDLPWPNALTARSA